MFPGYNHSVGRWWTRCLLQDNEYCIYSTNQQVLRYIIQYSTAEDRDNRPALFDMPCEDILDSDTVQDEETTAEPVVGKSSSTSADCC